MVITYEMIFAFLGATGGFGSMIIALLIFWGKHKKALPDLIKSSLDERFKSFEVTSEKARVLRAKTYSADFNNFKENQTENTKIIMSDIKTLTFTINGKGGIESRMTKLEADYENLKKNCILHRDLRSKNHG